MVESEREMVRRLQQPEQLKEEKFTSLQPTYEDTVAPETDDWGLDEDYGS